MSRVHLVAGPLDPVLTEAAAILRGGGLVAFPTETVYGLGADGLNPDGVARIYGLTKAMSGEMLEITATETGEVITGLVLNLEQDNVGAAIMGDYLKLKEDGLARFAGLRHALPGPALRRDSF